MSLFALPAWQPPSDYRIPAWLRPPEAMAPGIVLLELLLARTGTHVVLVTARLPHRPRRVCSLMWALSSGRRGATGDTQGGRSPVIIGRGQWTPRPPRPARAWEAVARLHRGLAPDRLISPATSATA
jgi:hypothetical protein